MSKRWADGGVASLHVINVLHPGAFHVTFVSHKNKVAIWIQSGYRVVSAKASPRWGLDADYGPTATRKQTASPDYHVPSGSMLKDNSVAWGALLSHCRVSVQVFCSHFFPNVVPLFCTDLAGTSSANAGSVMKHLSFVILLYSSMCNKGKVISVFSVKL